MKNKIEKPSWPYCRLDFTCFMSQPYFAIFWKFKIISKVYICLHQQRAADLKDGCCTSNLMSFAFRKLRLIQQIPLLDFELVDIRIIRIASRRIAAT
jgi:hypothetical protein